jgi:hypothetical protein
MYQGQRQADGSDVAKHSRNGQLRRTRQRDAIRIDGRECVNSPEDWRGQLVAW